MALPAPGNITMQFILMLISTVFIALGVFMYVPAGFVPLAPEGTMVAIARIAKAKFGNVKLISDISMVVISGIVCLIVIKELGSVGVGTVIAALLVGNEVKLFVRCFGDVRDRLLGIGTAAKAQTDESPLLSIMKKDVYTLRNTSSIMDALQLMKEKRISGCPIVDDHDDLTGFISNGDIIRRLSSEHSIFIDSHSFEKIEFNEMLHDVMTKAVSEFAIMYEGRIPLKKNLYMHQGLLLLKEFLTCSKA